MKKQSRKWNCLSLCPANSCLSGYSPLLNASTAQVVGLDTLFYIFIQPQRQFSTCKLSSVHALTVKVACLLILLYSCTPIVAQAHVEDYQPAVLNDVSSCERLTCNYK